MLMHLYVDAQFINLMINSSIGQDVVLGRVLCVLHATSYLCGEGRSIVKKIFTS